MKAGVKKSDLPVWTATSAIPFGVAPRPLVKGNEVLRGDGEANGNADQGGVNGNGNVKINEVSKAEGEKEVDIWAVPETPDRG